MLRKPKFELGLPKLKPNIVNLNKMHNIVVSCLLLLPRKFSASVCAVATCSYVSNMFSGSCPVTLLVFYVCLLVSSVPPP